jgi:hypothetical protein
MKKLILILIALSLSASAFSQDTLAVDTTWKRGGFGSLQFNQVAFSHWAAGGENSLSFTVAGFGFANYLKGKNFWNSYINFNYGVISTQYDKTARKNTDILELQTKAGHDIGKKFYFAGLINFRSQFASGYLYPNDSVVVSKFMAPGYLTVSIGIDWRPKEYFSLYLSPTTGRFTFVADQNIANIVVGGASLWGTDPAVYDSDGVLITPGSTLRTEFGAYVVATFLKDVAKNVNVGTKLQLFMNYTDPVKANRTNVDVLWDLLINLKVNSWLSASIFGNLIYDNDIVIIDVDKEGQPTGTSGPRTQLKEGIGIGLTLKFGDQLPK